jgi:hypothetical protein
MLVVVRRYEIARNHREPTLVSSLGQQGAGVHVWNANRTKLILAGAMIGECADEWIQSMLVSLGGEIEYVI